MNRRKFVYSRANASALAPGGCSGRNTASDEAGLRSGVGLVRTGVSWTGSSVNNPLGARALYIFQDGVDKLYRVHGSQQASSIGRAVSSGCLRLLNRDVIDLYDRVPTVSKFVVT